MPSDFSRARNLLSLESAWAVETAPSGASNAATMTRRRITIIGVLLEVRYLLTPHQKRSTPMVSVSYVNGRGSKIYVVLLSPRSLPGGQGTRDDGGFEPVAGTQAGASGTRTGSADGHAAHQVSGSHALPRRNGLADRHHRGHRLCRRGQQ